MEGTCAEERERERVDILNRPLHLQSPRNGDDLSDGEPGSPDRASSGGGGGGGGGDRGGGGERPGTPELDREGGGNSSNGGLLGGVRLKVSEP